MQSQEQMVDQCSGLDISEFVSGIQLLPLLKSFFRCQHLHLKMSQMVCGFVKLIILFC